jgi:hypothetical protein
MRATPRNLQARLKILKKLSEHQIIEKSMSTKFVWEPPDGTCRLDLKLKNNDQNINSTNKYENFPKKSMFSALKVNRSQMLAWEPPDGIYFRDRLNNKTYIKIKNNSQALPDPNFVETFIDYQFLFLQTLKKLKKKSKRQPEQALLPELSVSSFPKINKTQVDTQNHLR